MFHATQNTTDYRHTPYLAASDWWGWDDVVKITATDEHLQVEWMKWIIKIVTVKIDLINSQLLYMSHYMACIKTNITILHNQIFSDLSFSGKIWRAFNLANLSSEIN